MLKAEGIGRLAEARGEHPGTREGDGAVAQYGAPLRLAGRSGAPLLPCLTRAEVTLFSISALLAPHRCAFHGTRVRLARIPVVA